MLIWRRRQLRENGASEFEPVPYDFHRVRLNGLMNDPAAAKIIYKLEEKLLGEPSPNFDESHLLQIALFQSGDSAEPHLERWLTLATDAERLERLADFARESTERRDLEPAKDKALQKVAALTARMNWPLVVQYPKFVQSLLAAARGTNAKCHESVFSTLSSLPVGQSTKDGEPDDEWKALLESVDKLAANYQGDTELGPFYTRIAAVERASMEHMRRRDAADLGERDDG